MEREFFVAKDQPYQIYSCSAREGNKVYWQLEVEYQEGLDPIIPRKWTAIDYVNNGASFSRRSFHVQEMAVNPTLAAELFEKSLEPGMVGFHVENNAPFEVQDDGSLGSLGSRSGLLFFRRLWTWFAIGLLILIGLVFGRRYLVKRQRAR
jgi:hypothetical protein